MKDKTPKEEVEAGGEEEVEEVEVVGEQATEPRKPSEELKVVILLKGNRAMVGIQSPECDPIFTTLDGGLPAALSQVPSLVESANAKWDASPRNPKAKLPEPPPAPAPDRNREAKTKSKPKQPSFF